jgi:ribosomal protein L3 glutamine methyltransferase
MSGLPDEYRHEPALALGAGADGMDIMRRMMPALAEHLTPEGIAVIEIGDGREAFEAIYPDLPVTWLTTSGGDDLVFVVRAEDLKGRF